MEIVLLTFAVLAYVVYKILKMPVDLSTPPDFMVQIDAEMGYPLFPQLRPKAAPVLRDVTSRQTEDDARQQREEFLKANPDIAAELAKRHLTQGVQPRRIADMRVIH